ncbi:hypothetical protein VTH06DRAFT_7634 [Thermothelomyces fergusii]
MQASRQENLEMSENCGTAGFEADLDSGVSSELIAKTDSLSIAESETVNGALTCPANGRSSLDQRLAAPLCSPEAGIQPYLEVCDLLAASRTSHHLRALALNPHLHQVRLRRTRAVLPPLLTSPSRPSRADLVRRSIVLTHTAFASRRLARSLASIRLARQLAKRPSAETLVERCVLPPECLPPAPRPSAAPSGDDGRRRHGGYAGVAPVAPALVARKRAVERERVKDGLRAWVGSVWKGEVGKRQEKVKMWEERAGVGRVWRLRRFWEKVGRGEQV